jgi:hypothetical protein
VFKKDMTVDIESFIALKRKAQGNQLTAYVEAS